jgi:hypothetical protein
MAEKRQTALITGAFATEDLDGITDEINVIVGSSNRVMSMAGRLVPRRMLISVAKTLMKSHSSRH